MKHILVTNLDYIIVHELMLHVHAMLIDDQSDNPKYKRCTLRGFGTDPSWPVFQIHLKSGSYTRENAPGGRDTSRSFFTFASGGPVLQLIAPPQSPHDFDVLEIEGDNIEAVWKELPAKVARYWDGPNMPVLTWTPTPLVGRSLP